MDAFFRAVAIGLGVLLGTFNQGVEPELHVLLHKGEAGVMVTADLEGAISPKMEEALLAGVPQALTLVAEVGGHQGVPVSHVLSYLPLTRQWQVGRPGQPPRVFVTKAEAERDWCSWVEVPAGAPGAVPFTVSVLVTLSFPDRPDWKADMVWKAPVVSWSKSFTRMSEIPF